MEHELAVLSAAVREAGQRAMEISASGPLVQIKADHSPVTSGDLEVDRVLRRCLGEAFPADAWLSEESPDAPARLEAKRVWIVDPIDGTKYFIERVPQFAISVALVEAGEPQVAVVFNPATDELFAAIRGRGATLNGVPVHVATEPHDRFVLFGAPPAIRRGKLQPLETITDIRPMGSIAYTLALISAGHADATVNISRMHEWDIAAGVLLIEEAGGVVFDARGMALRFNKPDTAVQGIIAGRPETATLYKAWLAELGLGVKR